MPLVCWEMFNGSWGWERNLWVVAVTDFGGINSTTVAAFKLVTLHHWTQSWEGMSQLQNTLAIAKPELSLINWKRALLYHRYFFSIIINPLPNHLSSFSKNIYNNSRSPLLLENVCEPYIVSLTWAVT